MRADNDNPDPNYRRDNPPPIDSKRAFEHYMAMAEEARREPKGDRWLRLVTFSSSVRD
jgi:hypothetical protein